ncbi:LORF2 protein, partial [Crocuta crocuta]
GYGESRALVRCCWEGRMVQPGWDPSSATSAKGSKAESRRDLCAPTFTAAWCTIAKSWKPPTCLLTDERAHTMWSLHTREYYSVLKRKEILACATTWIYLEDILLSEIS